MKLRFGLLASNAGTLEPWLLSQFRPYGLKMLRQYDSGDPDRFERCRTDGEYILCQRFSEKLHKIMGRTRGVFSSPKSEGARGFKSSSLRQAGRDLCHSLEIHAKFAQVRGFPHRQMKEVLFAAGASSLGCTGTATPVSKFSGFNFGRNMRNELHKRRANSNEESRSSLGLKLPCLAPFASAAFCATNRSMKSRHAAALALLGWYLMVPMRVARAILSGMPAVRLRPGSLVLPTALLASMAPLLGACTYPTFASRSTGVEHAPKVDAALRQKYEADIEQSLKVGDVGGAVEALRRYQQIDPEDKSNIARWKAQVWSAVAAQDQGIDRHQKKAIHRTLAALREDYPDLRAMNQRAFEGWIGKDTSAAGVPMLSGIAISGHTLELKVPDRNLSQSALAPQKFAQLNDAFSVWCRCDGATHVASDTTGFPVYLARLNPAVSRSEVLVLPQR
jgi:hypothetical protein